jgi:hypothetical protein
MKISSLNIYILVIVGLFVSGCAHPTTSYQINASNTAQLSSIKGSASPKISVGEISKVIHGKQWNYSIL